MEEQSSKIFSPLLQERDACGVGFVVDIEGRASHKILQESQRMLVHMHHRGGCQCDDTGDGAGVMTGIPHTLYREYLADSLYNGNENRVPGPGYYATGILFMDTDTEKAKECMLEMERIAIECSLEVMIWRDVPCDDSCIGNWAKSLQPNIKQLFLTSQLSKDDFRKQVYLCRKIATHEVPRQDRKFYLCSLSTDIITYKGLLTPKQLAQFYPDLVEESYETHFALVHSRFSTNTNPSWERAHPQRLLAHNGEINTIQGNIKNMMAREGNMSSKYYGNDLQRLFPVIEAEQSDSGCVDNVVEFLTMAGNRSLPEAVMTLVPEAWQNDTHMTPEKKLYYKWASCSMEAWDGPALLTFSDGNYVGAVLDRNGLRPSRYYVTKDGLMIMASEVGVSSVVPENITYKGRLMPGRMLLVNTKLGSIINDGELKHEISTARPVKKWIEENLLTLEHFRDAYIKEHGKAPDDISQKRESLSMGGRSVETDRRMPLFGYSVEDLNMLLLPMIINSKEALGSMGNDTPLACMTMYPQLVFDYFKQLFAQVTNPPIDPFREKIVMSLECPIGPEANLLEPSADQCKRIILETPILSPGELLLLKEPLLPAWKTEVIDLVYPVDNGLDGLVPALDSICHKALEFVRNGISMILLTDRKADQNNVPISSLLATGAVHQHLVKKKSRRGVSILVETGEGREIHHICLLLGYGADAICPYLVFETFSKLRESGLLDPPLPDDQIIANYRTAAHTGIRKVMAKMGISTLHSYKGSQIFEAVGLAKEVMEKCFTGTVSRIAGTNFKILAQEALDRHRLAFSERECDNVLMNNKGAYHWRDGGEMHVNDPRSIAHLQAATRNNNTLAYEKYVKSTMHTIKACTLRGQFDIKFAKKPIPLSEVEDAANIVRRFCTGAMSFGSISEETHTSLAVAMNRIGGKSNSGEGGEDPARYIIYDMNNNKRSAIKQIASGRFGVTSAYLANADDLQIKMAQGAKPGEGGELPGHKVTEKIAETRHSVLGVGLISPPPHHDIYSIEDLAQLIYDLKCANPNARISVKLVSEIGVGVIASGVVKGLAEHIVISGHDGGTGASSWTGVKHAGLPWEFGLSETHQTLVQNRLRDKVILQTDGQLRTGRDVLVAALLGADEFGFSTAPLIALGCTMMRKCHLNTCPVGVATQDPVLRAKFDGKPEYVINYFFMVAEEVRLLLSKMGYKSLSDVVGQSDLLKPLETAFNEKTGLLDFSTIFKNAEQLTSLKQVGGTSSQNFELESRKDWILIEKARDVIDGKSQNVKIEMEVENIDRAFATTLSYEISKKYLENGLPDDSIHVKLNGCGGQSFGAFLARGVTLELEGDANDYIGKGLSGGKIIIYPSKKHDSSFKAEDNIIVGNVCLYGATSGKAFFNGIAAERFCVRNSGAVAVVEGCGDHGCEYMTGGISVVLGPTGRNFAAGMSGGIAYVLDRKSTFASLCNMERVALDPLEEEDTTKLYEIVKEHYYYTKSAVAKELLENWSRMSKQFLKVFPHDYRRALMNMKKATEEEKLPILPVREEKEEIIEEKKQSDIMDIEDSILNKEHEENMFNKALDKQSGFVKYERSTTMYRPAKQRAADWEEIYSRKNKRELKVQAARCMDCGVPFCQSHTGCPLGNVIPKWNDLVFQNKWKEALDRLLQTNNFPEFTGRVCPAPCEGACVLSINAKPVTIKSIECAIIDHAFERGWMKPQLPVVRTDKKNLHNWKWPGWIGSCCSTEQSWSYCNCF